MKKRRVWEVSDSTKYVVDLDKGEGVAFSVAYDLDRATDLVAQHIGSPINCGDWQPATVAEMLRYGIVLSRNHEPQKLVFEISNA